MKLHYNLALGIIAGLEEILREKKALRPTLNQLLKQNRKWGSRDRRLIGEGILEIVRWKRKYEEMGKLDPHSKSYFWNLLATWMMTRGNNLPDWDHFSSFNAEKFSVKLDEKTSSRAVNQSLPDWLDDLGINTFKKTLWEKEITHLNTPAPLYIRANTLKTTPEKLKTILKKKYEIESVILPDQENALRLDKHRKLTPLEPFKKGLFEVQDINSQKVSTFANPKPGMFVIDACAGAGGKTLHLAALMQNKGKILALDPNEKKLEQLEHRIKRNGVRMVRSNNSTNEEVFKKQKENADLVLIDAPCSGLGVLRRNPATKWHMDTQRIEELIRLQQEILQKHAPLVKKGGTLVYATCSIFPNENENQVQFFLKSTLGEDFCLEKEKTLLSHLSSGDGFYMARLTKK